MINKTLFIFISLILINCGSNNNVDVVESCIDENTELISYSQQYENFLVKKQYLADASKSSYLTLIAEILHEKVIIDEIIYFNNFNKMPYNVKDLATLCECFRNYHNDAELKSIISSLYIEYTNEKFYSTVPYDRLESQISEDEFSEKIIYRIPFLAVVFLYTHSGEYGDKYRTLSLK